jgi:integrase
MRAKAKAEPQPCFTNAQVNCLIEKSKGEENLAFALMGYAGLRIGEVEQLQWEDISIKKKKYTMIHIRHGGSNGTTKDKEERFVPVHPKIAELLETVERIKGTIFRNITERKLLNRLKKLCQTCNFEKPREYKLHSFRHHFASLCANHNIAYRKALAWLGHSSSQMLDLYYHLYDEDSQQAMTALANFSVVEDSFGSQYSTFEGKWPV